MTPRDFTRREILAAGLASAFVWTLRGRSAAVEANRPPHSLLELIDDPLLQRVLYASPKLSSLTFGADGSAGVNQLWARGEAKTWFIELQRISGDLVQAGVGLPSPDLVAKAVPVIRWGFAKQAADGGFPGSGDPFHSTEIFVSDTGRALLLLKQSSFPKAGELLAEFGPKLERAAWWLAEPKNSAPGLAHNAPYTHRRYILASALGITGELTSNSALAAEAKKYAEAGLALQTAEGVNPEKGGFDVNYQSAGLLFAARYFPSCQDAALRERLRGMLQKGLDWLQTKVTADGELVVEGSTRVAGQEHLRGGKLKTVNYMELVQTFAHGAKITGHPEFANLAARVADRHSPIGPDQLL